MSILQRYVLKELAGPFALGMVVFTFIFLVGRLFLLINTLLNSSVPPMLVVELILSLLPNIFSLTIPMAILVAILLGIGRLASDKEILAIRTSGVNLMRVVYPGILVSLAFSGILIYLNQSFVPYLNLKTTDLGIQMAFEAQSAVPPDQVKELEGGSSGPSTSFMYEARDKQRGGMRGVRIHTLLEKEDPKLKKDEDAIKDQIRKLQNKKDPASKAQLERLRDQLEEFSRRKQMSEALILADHGMLSPNLEEQMLTLNLTSGTITFLDAANPTSLDVIGFDSLTKNVFPAMGREDEKGGFRKKPRDMVSAELRKTIADEEEPRKRNPMIAEHFRRFSIPLACIAFTLIGIPLAVYTRPTGKAVAFAISFLLILVYYSLLQWGLSLGKTGSSWAALGIFFPNILLSAVGIGLLYRMVMR